MREFEQVQIVKLSADVIDRARTFARRVVGTVNYDDSGQSNAKKIEDDHFVSKLGEEAVASVYRLLGEEVKGPDYTIYKGRRKSWAHDLFVDEVGLAVKTQRRSAARRYGLSWTFQAGKTRRDPILDSPEAWVCFVAFDDLDGANTCYVYPTYRIKDCPFKAPRLKRLIDSKIVVYVADLKFERRKLQG
jgi:hypothetical protein